MEFAENGQLDADAVSYDAAPLVEIQVGEVDYRVDTGLGAVVAISQRDTGTSTWSPVAQGRWDGVRLKAKTLGHPVKSALERAIALAMKDREEGFA
jgi:hypothetical protein